MKHMKNIVIFFIVIAGVVSCNNHDTSRAGVQDSTKVSLDDPKAVVADSAKAASDSSATKKDSAH